ncbi:MAG: hypothetical protein K2H60_10985 [Muribaculaceae bacterium]|nr:hypothetical protein [Muribaculaceae bacterium]
MKKTLKFNSMLSFKAIESIARKAAAVAVSTIPATSAKLAESSNPASPGKPHAESNPKTKPKSKTLSSIEREIRAIFRVLSSRASENDRVEMVRPDKGFSYVAIINIYREHPLNSQKDDEVAYRGIMPQEDGFTIRRKAHKPIPFVKYVFYSNTFDPNRLDSVAIYGADVSIYQTNILKCSSFFGRKVVSATLEMGRRLFVDVKFAV